MGRVGEHLMTVRAPYYEKIKRNQKTVEARLFHKSYKKYKVGDELVFRRWKTSTNSARKIITGIQEYARSHYHFIL